MINYLMKLWQAYKEESRRIKEVKAVQERYRLDYLKSRAAWFDSETAKGAINSLQAYSYIPMSQQELKDRIAYENMLANVKEKIEDVMGVDRLPDECGQSQDEMFAVKLEGSQWTKDNVNNVYAREVWNKAIEEAVKICEEYGTIITVEEAIRKLKK